MKQMSLARGGFERHSKRTKRAVFLAEMDQVIPWVRYRGLAKNGNRLFVAAALANLYTVRAPFP